MTHSSVLDRPVPQTRTRQSAWARARLPWHYDHHMGPDQDATWCVTRPWFDVVMGTRNPYVGTPRETRDEARRALLRAERADR